MAWKISAAGLIDHPPPSGAPPLPVALMCRLSIARALTGAGLGATGVAAVVFQILGVIVTTSTARFESIGPARCSAAGSKAANLAALSFVARGVASCVAVAGRAL